MEGEAPPGKRRANAELMYDWGRSFRPAKLLYAVGTLVWASVAIGVSTCDWNNQVLCDGYNENVYRAMLLDRGADIHSRVLGLRTSLHQASQQGHTEVVDMLLRRGSVVDATDNNANTALHLACMQCNEGVVRLLLAAGASVTVEDDAGRGAMDWASEKFHTAIRQILQQHIDTTAHTQQLLLDSPCCAAGEAQEGVRRASKRAFRFRCNSSYTSRYAARRRWKAGRPPRPTLHAPWVRPHGQCPRRGVGLSGAGLERGGAAFRTAPTGT